MAKNLRSKLPESVRLHIHDVNKEVLAKFHTTYGSLGTVIVCGSSEEVVAKSVSDSNIYCSRLWLSISDFAGAR
jgi:hypothetical protein